MLSKSPIQLPESTIQVLLSFADDSLSMPNLYFCQPHAKNQGMLRAVLSINECESVVSEHSVTYVGEKFPPVVNGKWSAEDFAVISFRPDETTPEWRSGYYRLDSDLSKINEALLQLSR
jgi:hypothetical protein